MKREVTKFNLITAYFMKHVWMRRLW